MQLFIWSLYILSDHKYQKTHIRFKMSQDFHTKIENVANKQISDTKAI